jgi:hypothetical protein
MVTGRLRRKVRRCPFSRRKLRSRVPVEIGIAAGKEALAKRLEVWSGDKPPPKEIVLRVSLR